MGFRVLIRLLGFLCKSRRTLSSSPLTWQETPQVRYPCFIVVQIRSCCNFLISVAKSIQKSKPLKSATILAARSAIPAVLSRSTTSLTSAHPPKRLRISQEDKDRLLRIAKRQRKGPLNSLIDPKEVGAGSATLAPSEAVMQSGTYDVWDQEGSDDEFLKSLPTEEAREYLFSILKKPKIKVGKHSPVQPSDTHSLAYEGSTS